MSEHLIPSSITVPDRVFVQRLKEIDPRLDCVFNTVSERFTITYRRAHGNPVAIIAICDKNGGFRHPDARDIKTLNDADLHRVSAKERFQRTAQYMERHREKKRREARENMRDMTKDGKIQLAQRYTRLAGWGKGNSAFRRIDPPRRGKSTDELQNAIEENAQPAS